MEKVAGLASGPDSWAMTTSPLRPPCSGACFVQVTQVSLNLFILKNGGDE